MGWQRIRVDPCASAESFLLTITTTPFASYFAPMYGSIGVVAHCHVPRFHLRDMAKYVSHSTLWRGFRVGALLRAGIYRTVQAAIRHMAEASVLRPEAMPSPGEDHHENSEPCYGQ